MSAQSATGEVSPEVVDRLLADIEGVDAYAFDEMMDARLARWFLLPAYLLESPPSRGDWLREIWSAASVTLTTCVGGGAR